MLKAEDVTFRYIGTNKNAILSAKATFSKGTVNLISGDNGAGKTTFALILCGAIPYLIKGTFSGNVFWNNTLLSEKLISNLSSFVFQDPYTYFQGHTIQAEINLAIETNSNLGRIANSLLPNLPLETPLHMLSLGQQQRVALYSAISQPSPLVFLDEPFEFLDDSGIRQAIKLITHSTYENKTIIVIQRPLRRESPISYSKGYEVIDATVREGFPDKPPPLPSINNLPSGSPNVVIENLSFTYLRNKDFSIKKVNLTVFEGESVGLVGPNGCGKTTLFLLTCGLLKAASGEIYLHREHLKGKKLRRRVKCAFQNPEAQLFGSTVREELEFGLRNLNLDQREIKDRFQWISEDFDFELSADPFKLSFGQKKLLAIATTFLMDPQAILLDEPTAGLDFKNILMLRKLAERFLRRGGSLLISSHSLDDIKSLCHRILIMKDGNIVDELSCR